MEKTHPSRTIAKFGYFGNSPANDLLHDDRQVYAAPVLATDRYGEQWKPLLGAAGSCGDLLKEPA